jgi:glutamate/tyrosine decarboxylase-like PLP-dependent enzyme
MLGYPAEASGILVSGGSMANLLGLAVGRAKRAGFDVRKLGQAAAPHPMCLYASSETHSSVQKAVELMGLGSQALRKIPVNAEFQIDLAALETHLAADRQAGWQPFCLVGNAGTVNTGAFDDLQALAEIAEREGLWYHVDGAFGALAALSPDLRPLTEGMQRADSLAFDLHKWFGVPIEAGCVLVRDRQAHREAFALTPAYLAQMGRALAGGEHWYNDFGIQLTRGFRALKVWMSLKEHGVQKFGRIIRQNVAQASYLASLVDAAPSLERLAPVPLNIVCFRYNPGGLEADALNELNRELLARLQEGGIAAPSYTTLGGKFALRVANVNHRSRREDFDLLVEAVCKIGAEILPATPI